MRNWIFGVTLLTSAAIALLVFVSTNISFIASDMDIVDHITLGLFICSSFGFFCMAQSIRFFNHLVNIILISYSSLLSLAAKSLKILIIMNY
jgi:hypothetical protein